MRVDSATRAQRKRIGPIVALAVLTAALAAIGYWMLFSHFAGYDDEGYILMSAREYFAHGRLYDEVYSQYGPAFYVLLDLFQHGFGPVDNTSARLITLALWLGTAGSCAILVRRETGSTSLSLFTLAGTFLYLYFLQDEPFHPGALIIFLLAASSAILLALLRKGNLFGVCVVAASTGTLLILTKINVGVFYFAAVGAWALLNLTSAAVRRVAPVIVIVGLTALAVLLMRTLWGQTWVYIYVALFAVGVITVSLAMRREAVIGWSQAGYFSGAVIGVMVLVLTAVWFRGTSVSGLLDGVLLRPLLHAGNYSYAVDWRPGSVLFGIASVLMFFVHAHLRQSQSADAANRILVALRIAQAVGLIICFVLLMHARVIGTVFSYVAALLWISVVPLAGKASEPREDAGRGLLATILLLQYLHAYPVGGSQESWGTFLYFPLVALGMGELRRTSLPRAWTAVVAALMTVTIGKVTWTAIESYRAFARRIELGLPGANGIRLSEAMRSAYHILAINAVAHGDMLFSLPGMYSFNLWTGLPAPTAKNTTLWFTLLTPDEQGAIIRSLEGRPRACIILQESLVELMRAGKVPMEGPLVDYVYRNFARAFRVEGFAFLVRAGRQVSPINVAQLTASTNRINFAVLGDDTPIAAIEIHDLTETVAAKNQPVDSRRAVSVTPINGAGQATGPTTPAQFPLRLKGLVQISIELGDSALPPVPTLIALSLRDAAGKELAIVRVAE
jgi:hypothetical protein